MLESLLKGNGIIHDLNLEGAFPEPAPYRPRELYEALKATPLYDGERGQWNLCMSEQQEVISTIRNAQDQLLGVLVEACFSLENARAVYERIKATLLYDAQWGQWNCSMSSKQELTNPTRPADAQLLNVLVEMQFNPENSHTPYEALKATPLYDARQEQWNLSLSNRQDLITSSIFVDPNLTGVLIETRLRPKSAGSLYEKLKATPLYDAQREQWNTSLFRQELSLTDRLAYTQLLAVLVEAQFNPKNARALYEGLKASPLYDSQHGQWNWCMSEEQALMSANRAVHAQLLAILVEAKLLASLRKPLARDIPPLPVIKGW